MQPAPLLPIGSLNPAASVQPRRKPTQAEPGCWNTVGVYGNRSCLELLEQVHCHNCPGYANAAAQLLDRAVPTGYRQEWTGHVCRKKEAAAPKSSSAVLFRVCAEWLALPTQVFQEICERRRIHSLPHRRQSIVLGLANVRGELLICVSLGHLLGLERVPPRETLRANYLRLLVLNWNSHHFAFPVDEVHGTCRFNAQDVQPPPATVARAGVSFTQGLLLWEQRTAGLLDPQALFSTINQSLS